MSSKNNSPSNKSYFLFILVAVVAIGSGLLVQSSKAPPVKLPEFKKTILLPSTKALVDTNFTDHKGKSFGLEQFKGKWSILFFGFTNCPDVCPTTMQTLKQVKSKLVKADTWHNYQVVMVSVDPERDTPERLASYVPFFDPEFIGISGPLASTTSFAKNVGILFFKSDEMTNGGYDVDHGAAIILVNPEGKYAGVITAPHVESTISSDLIALADYAGIDKPNIVSQPSKGQSSSGESAQSSQNAQGLSSKIDPRKLSFSKSWIRPAPPGTTNMAAYFELSNISGQDIVIESSESNAFEMTMIHNTVVENGVASMQHMDELLVPANGSATLKPLGMHMMLMQPVKALELGASAEIVLVDTDGTRYPHTLTVRPQPE